MRLGVRGLELLGSGLWASQNSRQNARKVLSYHQCRAEDVQLELQVLKSCTKLLTIFVSTGCSGLGNPKPETAHRGDNRARKQLQHGPGLAGDHGADDTLLLASTDIRL